MSTNSAGIGVLLIAVISNYGASDEPFAADPVVECASGRSQPRACSEKTRPSQAVSQAL